MNWISVEKELPIENVRVLVWGDKKYPNTTEINGRRYQVENECRCYIACCYIEYDEDVEETGPVWISKEGGLRVSHWMVLPGNPYAKSKEEIDRELELLVNENKNELD